MVSWTEFFVPVKTEIVDFPKKKPLPAWRTCARVNFHLKFKQQFSNNSDKVNWIVHNSPVFFFLNLGQESMNSGVQRSKFKRSDQHTMKGQKVKKHLRSKIKKRPSFQNDQRSKINGDQTIKDQRSTEIKRSKINGDQTINDQRSTFIQINWKFAHQKAKLCQDNVEIGQF